MLRDEIAPAHREALGYIREYGMDLLKQLSDFLDLNRAEGGYVIPQPQLVEIGRAAEAVCGLLQSAAHKRQVTLQVESGRVTQVARIDPGHLKQVLFNLVHNAVKFSPVGGLVEVVVQPVGTSGLISISVTDEGPGVPEDQKQQIFEPYIQGGIPCPSGERGTGLGLALCKTLVELAGGSIAVHSSVAHGSTFVVMLQGDVTQVREPETFETRLESVH
jgi:signal transduction histidine kinase